MKFRVASYWDIDATFDAGTGHDPRMFPAKLYSVDGVRVARGSDFDNTGVPKGKGERVHLSRADAETLAAGLSDTSYDVRSPVPGRHHVEHEELLRPQLAAERALDLGRGRRLARQRRRDRAPRQRRLAIVKRRSTRSTTSASAAGTSTWMSP